MMITVMSAPTVVGHLSPERLYLQLAAILRERIASGVIAFGVMLTGEAALLGARDCPRDGRPTQRWNQTDHRAHWTRITR